MEFRVWSSFVWLKAVSTELWEFYYHLHYYHLLNKIPFRFCLLGLLVRQLRITQSIAFPRSTTKSIVCCQVHCSAVCWWLHLIDLKNRPTWYWVSPHVNITMSIGIIERNPACICQQLKSTKSVTDMKAYGKVGVWPHASLTFRRWIIFLILAHSVYKMWIIQEPNKLELRNKLHFKKKKTESIHHV